MEKYLNFDPASLEEMLAACKDFKERHNIRSALREIKGLKLDGTSIITYSFGSKSLKRLSSEPSPRKHQLPLKQSAIQNNFNENETNRFATDKSDSKAQGEKSTKVDENGNEKPQFRSYLYAGKLSSPKNSPRGKKDVRSPRKTHTAITRIKVLDKSDLVDKCTETEEGVIDTKAETESLVNEIESSNLNRLRSIERKDRVKRYESTPLPRKAEKEINDSADLDISAIEFSGDLQKVKRTSVLHRPVSVNSSSLYDDNTNSPTSFISPVISSPRKPRKIVSYRTSAFSPTHKLSPVSSTISRARLQSAPPTVDEPEKLETINSQEVFKLVNDRTGDTSKQLNGFNGDNNDKVVESSIESKQTKATTKRQDYEKSVPVIDSAKTSEEDIVDTQERTYTAKPIEIKRVEDSPEDSLVSRLRNKLESKRNRDFKSEILEFSYFTNKMKDKNGRKPTDDKLIVLSPVKNDSDVQIGENEVNSDINVISNYTNNKTIAMEENVDNSLMKKKPGLSRKNRIDSDEHKQYRKYRKKKKDVDKSADDTSLHVGKHEDISPRDQPYRSLTGTSPRKVSKSGSVRRKLPEIPVKQDIEPEDDETVHQRTIRLLQERRKERREKLTNEKEVVDKIDKSKMSPADLKKTLEQKLERSDSKRKANRVRRELQLLNRENELKSAQGNKSDDDTVSSSDKTDNEINAILTAKVTAKSEKDNNRILVQRSKSDIVRRKRAVSETDVLMNELADDLDQEEEERSVLKMFEIEEPLTPIGKIELIGSLMQEEAKLQEMLRKSTNFSEKRSMRAEVRQLRERRMAIEGTSDQTPVSTLRRSASVTAGVITHATPVYIVEPEKTDKKKPDDNDSQTNIEELRKKLSETQDYDEKKKIRLALRQLRQQSREGPTSGLKRSQSFIQQKSSEPIVNGNFESGPVLRSQSVNEKRDATKDNAKTDKVGKIRETIGEKDILHAKQEKVTRSQIETSSSKPPVSRAVQRHSSFNGNRLKETEKSSVETSKNLKNLDESVFLKNSVNGSDVLSKSKPKESNTEDKYKTKEGLKRTQSDRVKRISRELHKTNDVQNDKHDKSGRTLERHFGKQSEKSLTQIELAVPVNDIKKPVELLKDTVTKLENQKKNRILEKCEIFEKADRKESDRKTKSDTKEENTDNDKAKSKGPHILVSRADVERNKQNKLVNLRRDRSNSEPQILSAFSKTNSVKDNKQSFSQKTDEVDTKDFSKNSLSKTDKDKRVNGEIKSNKKLEKDKSVDTKKHLDAPFDEDIRLSPSLLWLEEKRKSLPLSKDIDKLMSTMDIEAAFSEILGAVEEFPEQTDVAEAPTADVPILEEESCDSSEMEEDLKKNAPNDINGEIVGNEPEEKGNVKNETKNNEIINEDEVKLEDGENNSSAIQKTSGIEKSEAKIQLSSNLSLDVMAKPDDKGAISVIHGDDGTVTVQEVSQVQEGDTTITEWKKLRRTQSKTETRETDTVVERKITSPGGSSSVYEKDVSKTKHKLTSRGSNYFTRNHYNIKRKKDLDGTELVEHDLSSVTENTSVSKNESWGDKSEAKVVLNRDPEDGSPLKLNSIQDVLQDTEVSVESEVTNGDSSVCKQSSMNHIEAVRKHLGRPAGCPEVKATLKETSAVEGDTTVLECTVVSSPSPSISWFKGDNQLTGGDDGLKIDYDSETGKATLTIHPVSTKDTGEYKCVFENPLGTASTKGRLLIKKKTTGSPLFVTELADVTISEGHSLCLECQVSDTDTVTWYKDGAILRSNADFKQTYDGTKAKLEIVEIFLDDFGTYSCAIKNADEEKKCSCKVTVEESKSPDVVFPVFLKKPETTIANELDPVIIDCEVIGSPEVTITWYLDGSKVKQDGRHRMSYDGRVAMLVVRKVSAEDSGKIECVAENSSGKVLADCHLVVKALKRGPSVTQPLSDLDIVSGNKVVLKCTITGEPTPEISWRKNGLVIGQMFDFKQTYNNHVAELEISKTCAKDTGSYECIATNEKGEVTTSCQMTVTDENVQVETTVTPEVEQQKVTVQEEKVQTAAVKTFTSKFEPKLESEQKQTAKSQASKVMLVRQGSLRSLRQLDSDKPLVRSGSLQSFDTFVKGEESSKAKDFVKLDSESKVDRSNRPNVIMDKSFEASKKSPVDIADKSKIDIDINKNYARNMNACLPETGHMKAEIEIKEEPKTVKVGSDLSSLCLESSNVKEVKPVTKFRAGGEIRRSQSVRTPGSEKPEWLQVKLRKVGSKPSPLAFEREKSKTETQDSSDKETIVQTEKPVSVQSEIKLSRSQSARIVDRNSPLALRDSTNSPSNQPNRDSVKLTPVSERAKIFQMRDVNSSSSSSGKSSPVDIISKAIHLSRTESLRSPVGNRSVGVQRSHSFKMEASSTSQGDVTLELSPQKLQKQEDKSDSDSDRQAVKYWDPTAPSSTKMDYSTMTDEEQLNQLLSKSDNFDERKKIRARIKEVRDQHRRDWEAKCAARKVEEDPIKRKHREADLMKQQKMQQFQKQAAEHHESKHLDMAEQQLRERMRLADEGKKRTMKEYSERGATHQESLHLEISERALQEKIKQADLLKKKTLDAYDKAAGKTDGKSVTTTRKVETVTKVGGATGKPAGRGGAMNAFKAMDAKNAPKTNLAPGGGRGANITRSPSAIKTMLLEWAKAMTREYTDIIEITNFSSSWNNGLAFCALIHHFYPDAFDINSLDPKQRRKNFELAFDTAEKLADIAPLLDVEDMVRMQKPDWKCVFTYVQSFYRKLNSHERNKAMP